MLHITTNEINNLYVVCDDVLTESNVVYLWRFVNQQTTEDYLIELNNILLNNPRADLFRLNHPLELDLKTGEHRYYIYQSDTEGREDFENMKLLAEGRAEVETIFQEDINYERESEDIVYKGSN